jgi:hypothetical protein
LTLGKTFAYAFSFAFVGGKSSTFAFSLGAMLPSSSTLVAIQLYSRDDSDETRMDYGIYSLAPAAQSYARKLMQADPSTYTDDVKAGVERFFSHWGARCAFMDAIRLRVKVGRLYNTKRNPPLIGTVCAAPARPTHAWPSNPPYGRVRGAARRARGSILAGAGSAIDQRASPQLDHQLSGAAACGSSVGSAARRPAALRQRRQRCNAPRQPRP